MESSLGEFGEGWTVAQRCGAGTIRAFDEQPPRSNAEQGIASQQRNDRVFTRFHEEQQQVDIAWNELLSIACNDEEYEGIVCIATRFEPETETQSCSISFLVKKITCYR